MKKNCLRWILLVSVFLCFGCQPAVKQSAMPATAASEDAARRKAEEEWCRTLVLALAEAKLMSPEVLKSMETCVKSPYHRPAMLTCFADLIAVHESSGDFLGFVGDLAESETELESAADTLLPDSDEGPQLLANIVTAATATSKTERVASASVQECIDGIDRELKESRDVSTAALLYVTVIRETPDYLPAWFGLSNTSSGKLKRLAITGFANADPENAFPWYLMAALEASENNSLAAFEALKRGNALPNCRNYFFETPAPGPLTYPAAGLCVEFDVVGMNVQRGWIERQMQRRRGSMYFLGSFENDLRKMFDCLCERASMLEQQGSSNEAISILYEVLSCGQHLLAGGEHDRTLFISGVSCTTGYQGDDLIKVVEKHLTADELQRLQAHIAELKELRKELRIWQNLYSPEDPRELMTGDFQPAEIVKAGRVIFEKYRDLATQRIDH